MGEKSSGNENSEGLLGGLLYDVLKSVLIGLVLFLFGVSILWMNEWHHLVEITVQQDQETAIFHGDVEKVQAEHEGRFLYLQGKTSAKLIREDWLQIDVSAMRLYRRVQRFERKATEEGTIGVWNDLQEAELPDLFNKNQKYLLTPKLQESTTTQLGAFSLSEGLVEKITRFERLSLEQYDYGDTGKKLETQIAEGWTVEGHSLYWKQSDNLPQVGDFRVAFYYVPNKIEVSLLARQAGTILEPFITKEGTVLEFLEVGNKSAAELYPEGQSGLAWMVWLFRLAGWVMTWSGLWCLIAMGRRVLYQLNLENRKKKMSPGKLSCVAALLCSGLVVASAWIYYQPLWATMTVIVLLLILIGGGYLYLRRYRLNSNAHSDLNL